MTTVYRNLKTGTYFVQPYTIGPVAATEFGDPTVIQPGEFENMVTTAVLENLEKFGKEQFDKSRAILRDDKQQGEFLKNHVGVGVTQQQDGGLVVHSLHRERGGMIGSKEDTFILSQEDISQKLKATMLEAFRRAT